jgi:hypothetical protein
MRKWHSEKEWVGSETKVRAMDIHTNKDLRIIFRHLLPELRPYTWSILASLGITAMVIGTDLLQPACVKWFIDAAAILPYGWP